MNGGPSLETRVAAVELEQDDLKAQILVKLGQIADVGDRTNALATVTAIRVARIDNEKDVRHADVRKLRVHMARLERELGEVKATNYRDRLDSQHDLEEVEETLRRDNQSEANKLRLELAQKELADAKEANRHWGRWVADKAVYAAIMAGGGILGIVGKLLLDYLTRAH